MRATASTSSYEHHCSGQEVPIEDDSLHPAVARRLEFLGLIKERATKNHLADYTTHAPYSLKISALSFMARRVV